MNSLGTSPISVCQLPKLPSHSVHLIFILLSVFFSAQFFSYMRSHLSIDPNSYVNSILFRESFPTSITCSLMSIFSSSDFSILGSTIIYLIHFSWFLCRVMDTGLISLLHMDIGFPSAIGWRCLFPKEGFWYSCQMTRVFVIIHIEGWLLYFVPLVSMSVFVTVPGCFLLLYLCKIPWNPV